MDDPIVLFILLIILALILTATVLPIVALVISIRTRSKLTKQLAALGSPPLAPTDNRNVQASLAQLQARVEELEALVAQGRQIQPRPLEPPSIAPIEQPVYVPSEPPPQQIPPAPPSISQSPPPSEPTPPVAAAQGIDTLQLESLIGRRLAGWAAVGLIL